MERGGRGVGLQGAEDLVCRVREANYLRPKWWGKGYLSGFCSLVLQYDLSHALPCNQSRSRDNDNSPFCINILGTWKCAWM